MTQYLTKKRRDLENLNYVLENYAAEFIVISPFSLGNRKGLVSKNLSGKSLEMQIKDEMIFFVDKKPIIKIDKNKHYINGFKIEYRDEKLMRIYPYYDDPNEPILNFIVKKTTLRNGIDDWLIEITFDGKIKLFDDGKEGRFNAYKTFP
ncbi:MAG: hypothetical protein KC516_02875 [Nanoarchaeota archaeon]|nr:hypothetical protein [Nanoarchaeota archaeon]